MIFHCPRFRKDSFNVIIISEQWDPYCRYFIRDPPPLKHGDAILLDFLTYSNMINNRKLFSLRLKSNKQDDVKLKSEFGTLRIYKSELLSDKDFEEKKIEYKLE